MSTSKLKAGLLGLTVLALSVLAFFVASSFIGSTLGSTLAASHSQSPVENRGFRHRNDQRRCLLVC